MTAVIGIGHTIYGNERVGGESGLCADDQSLEHNERGDEPMGWGQSVAAGLCMGGIILGGLLFLLRLFVGWVFERVFLRVTTDPYWENLFQTYRMAARSTPGNLVETNLRSPGKKPCPTVVSARRICSPWENILFNPVYLDRLPLKETNLVETAVVIGPDAARPLRIEIPLLIGGMAYGTLSALAKQALAIGATKAGTATNTGNGGYLEQERAAAERLIVQYTTDGEMTPELIKTANAVEIDLGQSAWGTARVKAPNRKLLNQAKLWQALGISSADRRDGLSRLDRIGNALDLRALVEELRHLTNSVPIGVKIGATQWLERELTVFLEAGVDFISIDGAEGGAPGGTSAVLDSVGIPTLHALVRARRFLDSHETERKTSLLIGGGMTGPGTILKALALGADAVFLGTAALLAVVHTQATKLLPWEPPTNLVFFANRQSRRLNPFLGGESLARFLRNCVEEMRTVALMVGRDHLSEMSPMDLSSTHPKLAEWLGISWVGSAPQSVMDTEGKTASYPLAWEKQPKVN